MNYTKQPEERYYLTPAGLARAKANRENPPVIMRLAGKPGIKKKDNRSKNTECTRHKEGIKIR